jgi:hypothetical protein
VNDSELKIGILLLLSNRRKHPDATVADLKDGLANFAFLVPRVDAMESVNPDLSHLIGDGVVSIPGKPVDTGAHKKMRACVSGAAEQFIDIALAIPDMHDALRLGQQRWIASGSPTSDSSPSARSARGWG